MYAALRFENTYFVCILQYFFGFPPLQACFRPSFTTMIVRFIVIKQFEYRKND